MRAGGRRLEFSPASSPGLPCRHARRSDVRSARLAADGVVEILGRGVFIGQDRVREYMHNLSPVGPRPGVLFNHMHFDPVTHVSADGLRATGFVSTTPEADAHARDTARPIGIVQGDECQQ